MTERGLPQSDGATACPFVAFEDERDERSDRPDHRHRCYAETPPAPRAIAHQEAYCLASAFPVCPTFQDWAQREAARTRMAGQVSSPPADHGEGAPGAGEAGSRLEEDADAAGSTARGVTEHGRRDERSLDAEPADEWRGGRRPADDDQAPLPPPPRRNPPRDWAAPPPWAGTSSSAAAGLAAGAGAAGAGAAAAGAAAGAGAPGAAPAGAGAAAPGAAPDGEHGHDVDAPRFLAERQGRGLAGSAADRLAAGEPSGPRPPDGPQRTAPVMQATPSRAAPPGPRAHDGDEELAGLVRGRRDRADDDTSQYRADARRRPAGRGAEDAPAWEEPRRYEAYPRIRSRPSMPGLPRIGIMVAALTLAALVLFALPGLLGWFGGKDGDPGAVPSPSTEAIETASPDPTAPPVPTPRAYTIKSGDTLSKIADRFGISLDDLLAANRDTIKNPDLITVGDQIIIPPPSDDGLEEAP